MYGGIYNHQMDEKGRLRIPSKIKVALGEKPVIIRGTSACLFILSAEDMKSFEQHIKTIPYGDSKAQYKIRQLASTMYEIEEDNQGRFLLPQNLRAVAGVDKKVVFVGAFNRLELWSEEAWNDYNDKGGDEIENFFGDLMQYGL